MWEQKGNYEVSFVCSLKIGTNYWKIKLLRSADLQIQAFPSFVLYVLWKEWKEIWCFLHGFIIYIQSVLRVLILSLNTMIWIGNMKKEERLDIIVSVLIKILVYFEFRGFSVSACFDVWYYPLTRANICEGKKKNPTLLGLLSLFDKVSNLFYKWLIE